MKSNKSIYKDASKEEEWNIDPKAKPLTEEQIAALGVGIPTRTDRLARKQAKQTRINIRLSANDLDGIKAQAEEAGMPYQTLAASVLHLVAVGKLKLSLVQVK